MDAFAHPALLPLGPLAVVLLWLLERWRQRPVRLVVADVGLFEPTPEVEAEARARRRRVGLRFLLLAGAALALGLAAAGPRGPRPPDGPLLVDVLLDRGVASGALERDGATRLEHHRRHLRPALDALRPDDRVRVHLVPGDAGTTPLSPADGRALLEAATPTAAAADLEAVLARVAPQVFTRSGRGPEGGAPVLVATDRALALDPTLAGHVLVAVSGDARPDRSILALARGEDGALHATVGAHDSAGPARVTFVARTAAGVETTDTREVMLPARGLVRATWPDAPRDAVVASAALDEAPLERDALSTNDRAFAAVSPPRRRVALVGEPGAAVRRALTAVAGTEVVELPADVFATAPAVVETFELVVVTKPLLPLALPRTAVVVVTPALPRAGALPGGRVATRRRPGFEHTLAELEHVGAPVVVQGLTPLEGFASAEPLLVVGDAPLVAVTGAGRSLVVAITAPLTPEVTTFTQHDAFPLFWAELLAVAAPRATGELAAHPAGVPWRGPGGTLTPLRVGLLEQDGSPAVGTVAAPASSLSAPAPPQGLPADLAARLAAGRRPGEPVSLAPALAGLALALLVAAWWERARPANPAPSPAPRASARR